MRIIQAIKTRRGSVAVMIGGIVLALLIFFGAFIKYSTSRQYATKRLNRVLLAREFSAALATLACHHLKDKELHNRSGKLVKSLEKPLSAMSTSVSDKIVFTPVIKELIERRLESANSELYELAWRVGWEVRKVDFKPVTAAYPREKTGLIRIPIVIEYRAPASLEKITEEYVYTISTRVAANLVPVLSRFTLYVKDARSGEDEERFNKIVSNDNGNLVETTYRPWILKNTGQNAALPANFAGIIKSSRGLVYLGGGRINLGISRGWSAGGGNYGTFAEGFHLLAEGRGNGFYKTDEIGNMALLNCETGLSKTDLNNPDSISWYDLIKSGYAEMSARTSMFKLFGTDNERSPTLVFGDTAARTLCGKAYRESSDNYGPLPYTYDDNQFEDYRTAGGEDFDFSYFMNKYSDQNGGATLNRSKYNREYASCLIEVPYNRALGYILTNHRNDRPLDAGVIAESDPLFAFVSGQAVSRGLSEKIPQPLADVYDNISSMSAMKELLEAFQNKLNNLYKPDKPETPAATARPDITLARGEKLLSVLQKRRYLDNGKLDLNRWLRIKAPDGIVLDEALRLTSHGGIILEEGNIEIRSAIKADGGKFLLNLVARRGNIIVDASLNGELDAALTAAGDGSDIGQVKFAGNGSSAPITIKGNVAMQRIAAGSLAGYCARGVNIVYAEDLAALPREAAEGRSEQPLLMFGLDYPRLLD